MKINIIIIIALSSIFLASCEKEVNIDLHSVEPKLVIEGKVAENSLAMVKLTKTKDFGENNNYPTLSGATIIVKDDVGNSETLIQNTSGWYKSSILKGVAGRTYSLSVTYEGKEYTATSKMPPPVPIDSLTMFLIPTMDYAFPRIHFKDPKGTTNNYYRQKVYINGKYIDTSAISAERLDGVAMVSLVYISEKKLDNEEIRKGDKIMIELQSIDKAVYTYFDNLDNINNSQNNPTSNISGGALGYFSAYSCDKKEIIANWE